MTNEKSKTENNKSDVAMPLLVGRKEYVAFPDWGIHRIRAKVDTGARSSALDVLSYDVSETEGQGLRARLRLPLNRRRPDRYRVVEAPVLRMVAVRNSGGECEQRPLIETTVRLGPVTRRIRLTLTDRAAMRYRMILGRQALRGQFVVDVSKKYLLGNQESGSRVQESADSSPDP